MPSEHDQIWHICCQRPRSVPVHRVTWPSRAPSRLETRSTNSWRFGEPIWLEQRSKPHLPFTLRCTPCPWRASSQKKGSLIHSYLEIYSYALIPQGTGVVTSVLSDSPDDFQTLVDLRKKPKFYNIDPEWYPLIQCQSCTHHDTVT